jgi:hypothetical protein
VLLLQTSNLGILMRPQDRYNSACLPGIGDTDITPLEGKSLNLGFESQVVEPNAGGSTAARPQPLKAEALETVHQGWSQEKPLPHCHEKHLCPPQGVSRPTCCVQSCLLSAVTLLSSWDLKDKNYTGIYIVLVEE